MIINVAVLCVLPHRATEVVLPDCSHIGPSLLRSSLLNCRKTLSVLDLQFCGRCINDGTISAFTLAGGFPALSKLCLGGTFRLSDSVLVPFLLLSPNLCYLDLGYYNHFTMKVDSFAGTGPLMMW